MYWILLVLFINLNNTPSKVLRFKMLCTNGSKNSSFFINENFKYKRYLSIQRVLADASQGEVCTTLTPEKHIKNKTTHSHHHIVHHCHHQNHYPHLHWMILHHQGTWTPPGTYKHKKERMKQISIAASTCQNLKINIASPELNVRIWNLYVNVKILYFKCPLLKPLLA